MLILWKLFRLFKSLGDFPDIHDEALFRQWVETAVKFSEAMAEFTPFLVDDEITKILRQIVESDKAWAILYALIVKYAAANLPMVSADPDTPPDAKPSEAEVTLLVAILIDNPLPQSRLRINSALIIQIIMMIVDFVQWFQKRKG